MKFLDSSKGRMSEYNEDKSQAQNKDSFKGSLIYGQLLQLLFSRV
jgi:hypothetical protein